jgi:hypothetical protein
MKSRLLSVLSILGLAAGGILSGASPASADVPCTITNFSPRVVNVGIAPVTATFGVSTTDCIKESWTLEGGNFSFYAYTDAPQETFAPFSNTEAGPQDVVATAYNSDFVERQRVFASGFALKRSSVWQTNSFNASPEPVRKGQNINIKARLLIADWNNDRWASYSNRTISVQFRTPTGAYTTVKTATTRTDGWVITTVPARATGVWRVVYGGNVLASAATSGGDSVQVNP